MMLNKVNELIRSERLSKLASSQEMTQNNEKYQNGGIKHEWTQRQILNHALKNRRNPNYNRRRVGKNLSF